MDGTIPRRALPGVLEGIARLSQQYDLRVANVFHAGDGNMHPLILFDANEPGEFARAEELVGRSSNSALKLAAASVGNMASGEKKSIKCAPSSTAMKSRPSMRSRRRLTPMVC